MKFHGRNLLSTKGIKLH